MPASPRGVLYCGSGDLSGYGQAAIAYVRALVNAGIPVQWVPLDWLPERMAVGSWTLPDGRPRGLLERCGTYGHLADLPVLVERTRAPVAHDTVVVHAPPEAWPGIFENGKRNIGVTVWETDRAPAHWLPLMRQAGVTCELIIAGEGPEREPWQDLGDLAIALLELRHPDAHRRVERVGEVAAVEIEPERHRQPGERGEISRGDAEAAELDAQARRARVPRHVREETLDRRGPLPG